MPDFSIELDCGGGLVCGVDEVGRGPWAGPVVAAAVILDRQRLSDALARVIDDSKVVSRKVRERIAAELPGCASISLGLADVAEIERLNIHHASLLAMCRAVTALPVAPATALVDGKSPPSLPCPVRCVVDGDALSLSIAAASIVAKVARDEMMAELGRLFPDYGFERHMGYGTREHRAALLRRGPTPHHRMGFPSVRALLAQFSLPLAEDAPPSAAAP